ncbi:MAG TPA: hypothetical protein VG347_24100, partial [Verrucomicrobiae bacterium]|nr:hypothetical protein [Verrucomicrobiae bacterium]
MPFIFIFPEWERPPTPKNQKRFHYHLIKNILHISNHPKSTPLFQKHWLFERFLKSKTNHGPYPSPKSYSLPSMLKVARWALNVFACSPFF